MSKTAQAEKPEVRQKTQKAKKPTRQKAANTEATLVERLLGGEPVALARAITAVENQTERAAEIMAAIHPHLGTASVIGFTGPPGAGKSTLINTFVEELRRRDKSVGIVAVDPSSPITGGAILGDRIRMATHTFDPGVFVRSLASRGHLGGLSRTAAHVIDVMDAAGRDVVVIETVGAGQSEVEIAEIAHTKVVVCAPGLGDDIQTIKAGILEIADILVVNKSDLPLADHTVRHLSAMLGLRDHDAPNVPIVSTTATTGEGMAELADAVESHGETFATADRRRDPRVRIRRLVADAAGHLIGVRAKKTSDAEFDALCDRVQRGEIDFDEAAETMLRERMLGLG